ncbi:hypothetical protein LSAT2_019935, partial [Lamellibrachia satsuma]
VVCFLLILVWGVNCAEAGHGAYGRRNADSVRFYHKSVCKSFCVKEYFQCYRDKKCHKPEYKQHIRRCTEQMHECRKKCLEEFKSMDIKEWTKTYVWWKNLD